ncbi:MAG: ABC transporter permease [Acidobacteriota bacterium]
MHSNRHPAIHPSRLLSACREEIHDAIRGLVRNPWFSLGIVVSIAIALAANAVLVAFLNAYFWKPLPFARAADHVEIYGRDAAGRVNSSWRSADARHLREAAASVLDRAYAFGERRATVQPLGSADVVPAVGALVTREYFTLVEPRLALGRLPFSTEGGGRNEPGIVLSDQGWRRLAFSRTDVVGQSVRIDNAFFVVSGVMAPAVTGLEPISPDFWILADTYESTVGPFDGYIVGGLLRHGVSAAAASDAMMAPMRSLPRTGSQTGPPASAIVFPRPSLIRERTELQPLVLSLLVAFALMTLAAGANLTGIFHARVAGRARAAAIRVALGATRGRLVRQVLFESLVLACAGGVLAVAGAWLVVSRLQGHVFAMVAQAGLTLAPVRVDWSVGLYTLLLAVAVGCACALAPALAAGTASARSLGGGGVRGGPGPRRALQRLVVAQAAITVPLLVVAGVIATNAARARQVDVGYDLAPLIDMGFSDLDPARVEQFRLDPRIADVTTVAAIPLAGQSPRVPVMVDGETRRLAHNVVDARFFDTLWIPILRGRSLDRSDEAPNARGIIVSESAARLLWPGTNGVGQSLDLDLADTGSPQWERYDVVGVAGDALYGFFFEGRELPMIYVPAPVASASTGQLLARVAGGDAAAFDTRALCRAYDASQLCRPMTLSALADRQRVPFVVAAEIASGLGSLTLVLACMGLYGLVSFSVVRQTRDIGVRMAIGATPRSVLVAVAGGAGRRMLAGVAIGLPCAALLLGLVEWRVPFVETFSPTVYLLVPAVLFAAGVGTALVPARRAARVDPIVALRQE